MHSTNCGTPTTFSVSQYHVFQCEPLTLDAVLHVGGRTFVVNRQYQGLSSIEMLSLYKEGRRSNGQSFLHLAENALKPSYSSMTWA